MKIAPNIMSRIFKDDLRLTAYKKRTGHFFNDNSKKNRGQNQNNYLSAVRKREVFTIDQCFYNSNYRSYAESTKETSQSSTSTE